MHAWVHVIMYAVMYVRSHRLYVYIVKHVEIIRCITMFAECVAVDSMVKYTSKS